MNNIVWTSSTAYNANLFDALQSGLTVNMIMTPRADILTCKSTELISDVLRRNPDRFSYIPVDDNGRLIGLFHAERWFSKQAPNEQVSGYFEALSEATLIGANAGIIEFVRRADEQPCQLVVSGSRIDGLVSLSDMQKLPVRAALFGLVTGMELTMSELIRRQFPDTKEWLSALSGERQSKISDEIGLSRQAEGYVDDILFTQFCDKADIIRKRIILGISKGSLDKRFKAIQQLRNDLAHSNDYAASPSAAHNVAEVVRGIFDLQSRLSNLIQPELQVSV